jgi:hypothetical protein
VSSDVKKTMLSELGAGLHVQALIMLALPPAVEISWNVCANSCHYRCPPTHSATTRWFSELLVLKSHGLLQLTQGLPYEDLGVSVTGVGIQLVMPHLAAIAAHHSASQR